MDAAVTLRIDLPLRRRLASIPNVADDTRTDAELIAHVADGDGVAFEELHRRYARSVLGIALRRIGDRGRAEDATQDTFASIWRSASRFDPGKGEATSWLYTVARNAIVDGLRRKREPPVDEAPEIAAPDPGPDDAAESGWVAWRVHRALETLPEQERSLVAARILERDVPERDRGLPRGAARDGQDPHALGAAASRGRTGG